MTAFWHQHTNEGKKTQQQTNKPTNKRNKQPTNQPTQPTDPRTNQPTNQSSNHPPNQHNRRPTNQPTSQRTSPWTTGKQKLVSNDIVYKQIRHTPVPSVYIYKCYTDMQFVSSVCQICQTMIINQNSWQSIHFITQPIVIYQSIIKQNTHKCKHTEIIISHRVVW